MRRVANSSLTVVFSRISLDILLVHQTLTLLSVLDQTCHIATHLLNLVDQTLEVRLHRVQEISQRCLDLLHLLLDTNDSLLELLANVGRTRIVLALRHEDLLSLDVTHFLWLQLDVVVGKHASQRIAASRPTPFPHVMIHEQGEKRERECLGII